MTDKITRVYERLDTPTSLEAPVVTFAQFSDDNPDAEVYVDQVVALAREDYRALGEPEIVSVTIAPRDVLR